jgi:lauroyl/myristoyl acyltransferase
MSASAKQETSSVFYNATLWRGALWLTRKLPHRFLVLLGRALGGLYWFLHPRRRNIVTENLRPALPSLAAAREATRELFLNFGEKLVDLWHFEAGFRVDDLFAELNGWEHFRAAKREGRGVLLLTIHLGNWEFGGSLMMRKGEKLKVLTLAEPGNGFTNLRGDSRAKQGIQTVVVGTDPFAFIEIIKQLEQGANVALLIDRPPAQNSVLTRLFGRPFPASIAAAELARASGAALVPVHIAKKGTGYIAQMLPEIDYDRAALGNRTARTELTQRIVDAFEPAIREYICQWYHFVPIWPKES